MKILIISSFDTRGGAARAAYRLFKGLKKFNIAITMIVQKKFSSEYDIIEFKNTTIDYDNIILSNYPNRSQTLFSSSINSNQKLIEYINKSDVDIVHLQWIANSFLSIEDLSKINKSIIWTLHDMWAFTGGCHYDENCGLYKTKCSNCVVLNSTNENDLSTINFNRKLETYKSINNLSIIGASKWISDCARQSSLLKNYEIYNLPYSIDTDIFKPYNKSKARQELNIKTDKKIILFGAMNATDDPRKGYSYLQEALNFLEKNEYIFLIFGKTSLVNNSNTIYLNHIEDDETLSKIYSCADVMVAPSIQENLANTIIEALSCGTPVVAFDIGGNSDMIEHKINGYLAKPFDSKDLANGIKWILDDEEYNKLCQNSRLKVLQSFSEEVVIPKYIKLYENIISNNKNIKSKYIEDEELTLFSLLINSFDDFINKSKNINFSKDFNRIYNQILEIDDKTVVYGNGTIGKTIQALIPDKIVGFVDMADEIHHPKNLLNMKYDKIIISVLGREEKIIKYLVEELNIDREKIVTLEI